MRPCLLILLAVISYSENISADNYAFLISAGQATSDNESGNPEFWYDLYLAYENLLVYEQYDSGKVFVFYGDGMDFNTSEDRYKKERHDWEQITDYNNSYNTMYSVISSLNNVITDDDNIFFYWVSGHAMKTDCNDDDSYIAEITHDYYYEVVNKTQLLNLINSITHYNKRKIFWMTCYSGAMGGGFINPNNEKTVLLTSSSSEEESYGFRDVDGLFHTSLGYAYYVLSTREFPFSMPYHDYYDVCHYYVDHDCDSLISLNEMYYGMWLFHYYLTIDLSPQLFDVGNISNSVFIGESKKIEDVTINVDSSYWLDSLEVSDVTFDNGIDVLIKTDVQCVIKDNTYVPVGSTLMIK